VRKDTWVVQIEQRQGADRYGFHPDTGLVVEQADGIPEILLKSAPQGADEQQAAAANVHCIDAGSGLMELELARQIQNGWSSDDCASFAGAFRFDAGPVVFDSIAPIAGAPHDALTAILGQPRICLLYSRQESTSTWGAGRVWTVRPVAGRVMTVSVGAGDATELTFQPCVITTRTAMLGDDLAAMESNRNPDIYKLYLTQ
jgi:hypothetical protein